MTTEALTKMPRAALVLFSGIGMLVVGAIGTMAGQTLVSHDRQLTQHETRLDGLDTQNVNEANWRNRIEDKIDRLLERRP